RLMLAAFGVRDFKDAIHEDDVFSRLGHMLTGSMAKANASEFSIGESEVESATYDHATGVLALSMSITYQKHQDLDRAFHSSAFLLKADVELIRRDGKWSLGEDGVSITSNDSDRAAHWHVLGKL
ncbi:hypothetical protein V2A47_32675, partial [Pseudomonas aeruginosa]